MLQNERVRAAWAIKKSEELDMAEALNLENRIFAQEEMKNYYDMWELVLESPDVMVGGKIISSWIN